MPGSDKSVKVALILDASLYGKGAVQASAATSKLGRDMDSVSSKTKAMESGLGKVNAKLGGLGIAAGAVAGGALVAFLTDSVKAAGDLEQSIGGVDSVFKDSAATVHAFGKESAESVGLSTNEFNQLVTATGAMLKNKGLEDFTKKSLDLVTIGADLAAQFGGPTSQAVDALNAAMRGESDPIERYGISLNETAVNAELARKGLKGLTGTALDQAKAQARIEIITRQSADAIGAFAREADTAQGQQQRLNAEWKNAQAELGTALLPAVTDVTKALRDGVDVAVAAGHAWGEIPAPVKAAVAALVLYHLTNGKVTSGLGTARDAIRRMRDELALQQTLANGIAGGYKRLGDEAAVAGGKVGRAGIAMGVASKAASGVGSAMLGAFGGPVGLAITAITVAIGVFAQQHAEAKARVEGLTEAIKADSGALGENTRAKVKNALETDGVLKAANNLGLSLADVTDAALGVPDAIKRVQAATDALAASQKDPGLNLSKYGDLVGQRRDIVKVTEAIKGQNGEVSEAVASSKRLVAAGGEAADAQQTLGDQTKTTTGLTDDQKRAVDEQAQAIRDAAKAVLDLADAQLKASGQAIDYQDALAAVDERLQKRKELEAELAKATTKEDRARITKELKEYASGIDLTTKAGRENQKTLNDLAASAKSKAEADLNAGASLKELRKGMADAKADFIESAVKLGVNRTKAEEMATQFGLTKKDVDNLAKSVKDLPASKQIQIEAETAAAAARLKAIREQLAGIKSKTVVITSIGRFVNADQKVNAGRSTAGGQTFAEGGQVQGYSPHAKADNILIRATAEEYVIKQSSSRKLGREVLDYINTYGQLPAGRAMGGPVGVVQSASAGKDSFGRGYMTGDLTIDGLNARIRAVVVDENEKSTRNTNLRRVGG